MHMGSGQPISIARVIGAILACVAAMVSVSSGCSAYSLARQIAHAETARPTEFGADLSKVGSTEALFVQTCTFAHGESILMEIPPPSTQPADVFKGLKGKLEIIDSDGKPVFETDIPSQRLSSPEELRGNPELVYFSPFEKGQYILRVAVTEPAKALAGTTQNFYARYWLCGLESLPVTIGCGMSVIAGVLSLGIGIPTSIGLWRNGWRRQRQGPEKLIPLPRGA